MIDQWHLSVESVITYINERNLDAHCDEKLLDENVSEIRCAMKLMDEHCLKGLNNQVSLIDNYELKKWERLCSIKNGLS